MVTITVMPPASPLVMPSDDQMSKLQELVYRLRPDLDLRSDESFRHLDHAREFKRAFWAVGVMGRRAEPDDGKAFSYWASHAKNLLEERGIDCDVLTNVLLAAALAHGDVPHGRNALGLTHAHTGAPASDAWRGVLSRAALRPPVADPLAHGRPPGRVVQLNVGPTQFGFVGRETW
jgi:hypothetical protein